MWPTWRGYLRTAPTCTSFWNCVPVGSCWPVPPARGTTASVPLLPSCAPRCVPWRSATPSASSIATSSPATCVGAVLGAGAAGFCAAGFCAGAAPTAARPGGSLPRLLSSACFPSCQPLTPFQSVLPSAALLLPSSQFLFLSEDEAAPIKAIDFGLAVFFDPQQLPVKGLNPEGTPW